MVGYFFVFVSLICVSYQQDIPDISTDETLTRWYLWTRQNPIENQEIFYDNLTSIEHSNFDSRNLPYKIREFLIVTDCHSSFQDKTQFRNISISVTQPSIQNWRISVYSGILDFIAKM